MTVSTEADREVLAPAAERDLGCGAFLESDMGLVVARGKGEAVRIGDDIKVTVTRVGEGVVRLHIEAPRGKLILRDELGSPQSTEG